MVYEQDFRGLTLLGLPATPRFVDVGGNYGQSIGAMRAVFGTAGIDCFEPNPGALAYLRKRWGKVGGVTLHGVGLGREPGSVALYVPEGGGISDVEGHELGVLQGAVQTLSRHHPPLLIERGERPEVMRFLTDFGYGRFVYTGEALTRSDDRPALNSYFLARGETRPSRGSAASG